MSEFVSGPSPAETTHSVQVQLIDDVAVVTFTRGRNNYLTYELIEDLANTLEGLSGSGARAAVLRTTSRHFCGGADFSKPGDRSATDRHLFDVIPRLFRQPLPIVAATNGASIGGGFGLALVADFRVAAESAYFAANFARLGICQGFGVSLTLPRLVGVQRAAELIYTGRKVAASEALLLGLVDRAVQPDLLDAEAMSFACEIASSSPLAVTAARRILRSGLADAVDETLRMERVEQQPLYGTDDFREGVQAWRERRTPQFRGV